MNPYAVIVPQLLKRQHRDAAPRVGKINITIDLGTQPFVNLIGDRHVFRNQPDGRFGVMLHMALVFLVVGIIAALLGFTTIAGAALGIAKFLAGLFLLLFLVFLIIGLTTARRIID
jgi:uncharacterized membrane protein YtjA (UPF0391 family)